MQKINEDFNGTATLIGIATKYFTCTLRSFKTNFSENIWTIQLGNQNTGTRVGVSKRGPDLIWPTEYDFFEKCEGVHQFQT